MQAAGSHGCEAFLGNASEEDLQRHLTPLGRPIACCHVQMAGVAPRAWRVAKGAGASGAQVVKAGSAYRFRTR